MSTVLRDTRVRSISSEQPAAQSDQLLRLGEAQALLAAKAAAVHQHPVADVVGLDSGVGTALESILVDSDGIAWSFGGGLAHADVRLRENPGLRLDADGLGVDFGTGGGQAAAGDHGHDQLHDPMEAEDTQSVLLTVNGQVLSADVRAGTGLRVTSSGVEVEFGTGPGQAAAGDHGHAQLHAALTVQSGGGISFALNEQVLSAEVNLGSGLQAVDGAIAVEFGAGSHQAAAGNHAHADATVNAAGFMSAADKAELDRAASLLDDGIPLGFWEPGITVSGRSLVGAVRFPDPIQVEEVQVSGEGGGATTLRFELDGVPQSGVELVIAQMPSGTEFFSTLALDDYYVPGDTLMRWRTAAGGGASRLGVVMRTRPAVDLVPWRLNAGGGAAGAYAADAYYQGGSILTTGLAVDTTGVTDPAPAAVYQSVRRVTGGPSTPLVYLIEGLPRGIPFALRLHFCEFVWAGIGDQVFDVTVEGAAQQSETAVDILALTSGVVRKAVVLAWSDPVTADAAGELRVTFTPQTGGASVCGLELIP